MFCEQCGAKLSDDQATKKCSSCGASNGLEAEFCTECGVPFKEKKAKWKYWLLVGAIFLILSGVAGVLIFNQSENTEPKADSVAEKESEDVPSYITKDENSEYRVLQTVDCYKEPGKEKTAAKLNEGSVVLILKTADFSDHSQVWGETEEGWCMIQKGKTSYLEKIQLKDSKFYEINQLYEALDNQPIYTEPSLLSKSNSDVRTGDLIEIVEIKEDQFDTIWGKGSSGAWIIMRNGKVEHFKKMEEENQPKAIPDQEKTPQKQFESQNGYILPDSDSRYIASQELLSLSLQEINYAKNEIYARHGRKFNSNELQNYFNQQVWYRGTISPNDFSTQVFNEFEKVNLKLLEEEEYTRSPQGYLLDQ